MALSQVGECELPAYRLDQPLVGQSDAGELALDAGRREPQIVADSLQGRPASRQSGSDRHPHSVDQGFTVVGPRAQRFEAGVHHRHHLQIAARHGAFQNARPEYEGIGRLRETGRGAEGGFVLLRIQRPRVLEVDRLGSPASPQTLAEDVEKHAERQLRVLAAFHDVRRPNLVMEHQPPVAPGSEAEQ